MLNVNTCLHNLPYLQEVEAASPELAAQQQKQEASTAPVSDQPTVVGPSTATHHEEGCTTISCYSFMFWNSYLVQP